MLFWVKFWRRRAHQRQESLNVIVIKKMAMLSGLVLAHITAMMALEGLGVGDAIWLTFTTLSTTGYGDLSAKTDLGRTATIILMYCGGIVVFGAFIASISDYISTRRDLVRHGKWNFHMQRHLLVIGLTKLGRERYLRLFAQELRSHTDLNDVDILLMAPDLTTECLPEDVMALDVRFNVGSGSRKEDLIMANAAQAEAIIVLCPDPHLPEADDITASVIRRLRREVGFKGRIVAEVALDENRGLVIESGANNVTRATNDYPGIVVKALLVPGSESVLEDFFQKDGADLAQIPHDGQNGEAWLECAGRLLRQQNLLLVGYQDRFGATHKFGTEFIRDAKHLIVLKPPVAA